MSDYERHLDTCGVAPRTVRVYSRLLPRALAGDTIGMGRPTVVQARAALKHWHDLTGEPVPELPLPPTSDAPRSFDPNDWLASAGSLPTRAHAAAVLLLSGVRLEEMKQLSREHVAEANKAVVIVTIPGGRARTIRVEGVRAELLHVYLNATAAWAAIKADPAGRPFLPTKRGSFTHPATLSAELSASGLSARGLRSSFAREARARGDTLGAVAHAGGFSSERAAARAAQ